MDEPAALERSPGRKDVLTAAATDTFADFKDVVLPFDTRAARRYRRIVVDRETAGLPISSADAQFAAVCGAHNAVLATRNASDFELAGVRVINPWQG